MAYPYYCDPCLDGKHEECEKQRPVPGGTLVYGGGFCVCSHGKGEEGKFERSVRERAERTRRNEAAIRELIGPNTV